MADFDYEKKVWGANSVSLAPTALGYFHLKYALLALKNVKGRVLDLGCGGGGLTAAIKYYRPDLEVWGIDISKKVIDQAQKTWREVNFKVVSVYKTGFPDGYFDAVVAFDVFEHLEEPEMAAGEVKRILKKGGLFHTYTPCEGAGSSYTYWVRKLGWRGKEINCGHIQAYSFASLKKLFEDQGFKITKTKNSGYLLYQLVDFSFFSWLTLRGNNLSTSVETLIAEKKGKLAVKVLNLLKKTLAFGFYLESSLLSFCPGFGLHLTAKKKN